MGVTRRGAFDYPQTFRMSSVPRAERETIRRLPYRVYVLLPTLPMFTAWTNLLESPALRCPVESLLGALPIHVSGLFFESGTEQALHSDTWYKLHGVVPEKMLGAWIALEDTDETLGNGPLEYVPGSHKLKNVDFEPAD